jgi:hypothetical protein
MPVARIWRLFSPRFQSIVALFLWMSCGHCYAQSDSDPVATHAAASAPSIGSGLRRGTNEFGLWTGYSPFSFVLKGTAKDRQLFLFNLQYARTLLATAPLTLKYTAEIVPVAFEIQPTQKYLVDGKELTNPAGTIYGAGATPIGLQANLGRRKILPCINGTLGFLYFRQQVPILESSQFNYTISIGFGAQFFPGSGRSFTVGWKYFHLSNNYQGHLNPGLDSGLFYVGFSAFRSSRK